MSMAPDFPTLVSLSGWFSRRDRGAPVEQSLEADREVVCARREFLNRVMCENASAIEGEHGMQAIMSMYPRQF